MPPKRKRTASAASKGIAPDTAHQATAMDVSGEDSVKTGSNGADDEKSMDPPTKRTRAASSASKASSKKPEKMHIETGGAVSMPVNGTEAGGGEHGEAGKMSFDPPPQAGSVDPAGGYKTNPPPKDRPVRVYADGVFDLMHLGHMRQLQQAKTAFPNTVLIVGVTGDAETHKRKGLTVMSAKERADSVRHCRWVDEVIEDCPWVIDMDFLEKHKIDYVAHDDIPYGANEGDDIYKPIKEKGMFLVTQRTEGVSTTGIITKIVRDYEQYIARQLRRGTSRQELNVSWLKKNELDIKRHVAELRDSIRTNWTTTGQELGKDFRHFWQNSRPNSPAPSATPSLRNGGVSPRPSTLTPDARASTPGGTKGRGGNMDFAAGYAMGLIGGVKGWMEGSRRRNLSDSRAQSPVEDSPGVSPVEDEGRRGRKSERDGEGGVLEKVHS